jgi:hypothetical protein
MESVHDHSGICYTLGRDLALVVTQAEAEFGRQAVPSVLRAPGLAGVSGALDASHKNVERGTGVALTKVSRREASNETVNAKSAHGLVAKAEAGENIAAHDEPPAGDHLAVLVYCEDPGPERSTGATRKNAEVVRVLKVFGEQDVTGVKQGRKL